MITCALTILGCNSAIADHGRNPTAQVLNMKNHTFLIDCGEGTQMRLQQYKVKWFTINRIFISHLHGDHFYGLIGLLTTFNLLRRPTPLTIYGPEMLKEIVELLLKAGESKLNYELNFVATQANTPELIFEDETLTVTSFPLKHKIPTTGFLFKEKPGDRLLQMEKLKGLDYDKSQLKLLKKNINIQDASGKDILAKDVTSDPHPAKSYAFCSDTMYNENMFDVIRDVDLLYHESTYLHEELTRAEETRHSTALQAGMTAAAVKAKQLLIGHYSSRYYHLSPLQTEACNAFENTLLAEEGKTYYF